MLSASLRSRLCFGGQSPPYKLVSSAATAAGTVGALALVAITAIHGATLGWLEGHLGWLAALGAGGRMEFAGSAAATTAVAATVTHSSAATATTASATGESGRLPLGSAIGASLGFIGEPAFRIPSLVLARVDEFRTTVRARNVFVCKCHLLGLSIWVRPRRFFWGSLRPSGQMSEWMLLRKIGGHNPTLISIAHRSRTFVKPPKRKIAN